MILFRKYHTNSFWPPILARSIGGKFQAANMQDFSDAVTLHTISDTANFLWTYIEIKNEDRFKYLRYLSSEKGHNNMAEVEFRYKGNILSGKIIGTEGSINNHINTTKDKVYDGDQLTFFNAIEESGAWSGIKLYETSKIDQIVYIFRNDDNNIHIGDTYELFYYNKDEWMSVGKKTADTIFLFYSKVPSNTIYQLKNHSRGKEERLFTYENGKQIFW